MFNASENISILPISLDRFIQVRPSNFHSESQRCERAAERIDDRTIYYLKYDLEWLTRYAYVLSSTGFLVRGWARL